MALANNSNENRCSELQNHNRYACLYLPNNILTTIFICQIAMRKGAPVEFCIVQMGMAPSITNILDRFIIGGANSIQTRQDVATMRPWWQVFTLL